MNVRRFNSADVIPLSPVDYSYFCGRVQAVERAIDVGVPKLFTPRQSKVALFVNPQESDLARVIYLQSVFSTSDHEEFEKKLFLSLDQFKNLFYYRKSRIFEAFEKMEGEMLEKKNKKDELSALPRAENAGNLFEKLGARAFLSFYKAIAEAEMHREANWVVSSLTQLNAIDPEIPIMYDETKCRLYLSKLDWLQLRQFLNFMFEILRMRSMKTSGLQGVACIIRKIQSEALAIVLSPERIQEILADKVVEGLFHAFHQLTCGTKAMEQFFHIANQAAAANPNLEDGEDFFPRHWREVDEDGGGQSASAAKRQRAT